MKEIDVKTDNNKEGKKQQEDEKTQDNIFEAEEVRIEEMAIDGICGVY